MTTFTIEQIHSLRPDISDEDVAEIKAKARELLPLAAIRECSGVTQTAMAKRLGKSQAAVSKFEGRGDFLLSTLYRHVCAVGGELTVGIKAGHSRFELQPTDYGDDVAFSLKKCSTREDSLILVDHARQYSSVQTRNPSRFVRRWARPNRRTSEEKVVSRLLVEDA